MTSKRFFSFLAVALIALFAMAQYTVLFIGDSITDGGWGNSGGTAAPSEERSHWDLNHIFGHGYMYICAAIMMADYPGEYAFYNRGISGNTLADLQARWDKDAIALRPDLITILVGTNDVGSALDKNEPINEQEWEARYDQLLDSTLQQLPGVKLVLCTPFVAEAGWVGESPNFPERKAQVEALAQAVRRLAQKYDAALLPYDELFASLQTPAAGYWIWDGIHPTAAGHKKMADMWLDTVPSIMNK